MKTRSSFIANSSSASFIVGIPESNRAKVIHVLYTQFEHDLFGSYYLAEAITKKLRFWKRGLATHKKKSS